MFLKAPIEFDYAQMRRLVILLGRYYQLRDDYKNFQIPAQVRILYYLTIDNC